MNQTSQPLAIRSLVPLLILLLTIQPLLAGCTVMNRGIGSIIDEEACETNSGRFGYGIERGDLIALRFVNGEELEGQLNILTPDYLDVSHYVHSKKVWVEQDTLIAVQEVEHVWRKEPRHIAESIGTVIGVLVDLFLVVGFVHLIRMLNNPGLFD